MIGKQAAAQVPSAEHVVNIGIDGLNPDGFQKAVTPYLYWLMRGQRTRGVRK
jgi:hypothetical protein